MIFSTSLTLEDLPGFMINYMVTLTISHPRKKSKEFPILGPRVEQYRAQTLAPFPSFPFGACSYSEDLFFF